MRGLWEVWVEPVNVLDQQFCHSTLHCSVTHYSTAERERGKNRKEREENGSDRGWDNRGERERGGDRKRERET